MYGLIKKDLILMRCQFHRKDLLIITILAIYFILGFRNSTSIIPILELVSLIIVSGYCNTLSMCDIQAGWKEYEGILPISARKKTASRYIVCVGMYCLIGLIWCMVEIFRSIITHKVEMAYLMIIFSVMYIYMMILIPVCFRRDGEKATNVTIVLLALVSIMLIVGKAYPIVFDILLKIVVTTNNIFAAIQIGCLLIISTIVSYKISLRYICEE